MRAAEDQAIAEGFNAEVLMEEAGAKIAAAVRQFMPRPGRCVVYFGKGHNGGDALVAARHLGLAGWKIELHAAFPARQWSALTSRKHEELFNACPPVEPVAERSPLEALMVLDGLLGIGAGGALREPICKAAQEINALRATSNARVFALDLPTGVDADTGTADADAVRADFTLTIGAPKLGLLADAAINHVGRLAVLPLAPLTARLPGSSPVVATPASLLPVWPRRSFNLHKGDCGRVGIVAGSRGFSGAAVMCAEAALHAGAGLVTLYVPEEMQAAVVSRIAPEIMVQAFGSADEMLSRKHDVLAVGPGVGRERDDALFELIARAPQPMVIDADALNLLAARREAPWTFAGPRLLTPHPGEMERLVPGSLQQPRAQAAVEFVAQNAVTLLLKGARTLVAERGRPLSYNSTGTPGMASGGMGDALTGVCAALAGQRTDLYTAARLGAWLCGRAAELAVLGGESEESLAATHVTGHLGPAFRALREGGY